MQVTFSAYLISKYPAAAADMWLQLLCSFIVCGNALTVGVCSWQGGVEEDEAGVVLVDFLNSTEDPAAAGGVQAGMQVVSLHVLLATCFSLLFFVGGVEMYGYIVCNFLYPNILQ